MGNKEVFGKMKNRELIEENLNQKIGGWLAGFREDKIKEHIIMLDWVLNDIKFIREIDEIIKNRFG